MPVFSQPTPNTLMWNRAHQMLQIEPWGADGVRVRATLSESFRETVSGLLPLPTEVLDRGSTISISAEGAEFVHGQVRVVVNARGGLRFFNTQTGQLLMEEDADQPGHFPARWLRPQVGSESCHLQVTFSAQAGERFYGLGQHQHGKLNQRGCVIDLVQRNTEVSIPFLLSSRGYGFLWNNPALGRVELSENATRWVAESTSGMDYVFIAGSSPADILEKYTLQVGRAPMLPGFAAGFWQCKLRYRTQEELLEVAREYKRRGLPISVIVIDFFHWTMLGDWKFDLRDWPDPAGMVRQLDDLGIKLMVSIWPTVNHASENFAEMNALGLLARSERGNPAQMTHLPDVFPAGAPALLTFYDPTHPEARRFIWEKVRQNYYRYGIKVFWLDACEPELIPIDHDAVRYHLGSALEVGLAYPMLHQRGFYEGMQAEGEREIINLCRSAWIGSQRYGAAVWSGDIASTFEVLQAQVRAGLNIGLSGIPWWTTDIGGFHAGDPRTPYFRELIVRWFQYGAFCPLFRLHGVREPMLNDGRAVGTGAANEVWSFGETAYAIIRQLMEIRERLKPYLLKQMEKASQTGLPPMRPLFVDTPEDTQAWGIEDEFLLGPDLLVAPVLEEGARGRRVYLPAGAEWEDAWTGITLAGGQWLQVDAPLERVPVFWKAGSTDSFRFSLT